MRPAVAALALFVAGCPSTTPTPQAGDIVVHRECAKELARAEAEGDGSFVSLDLSVSCSRDLLFALNAHLGKEAHP